MGKKTKKIIHGLIIITCWCVWKRRNEMVFQNIKHSPQDVLGEVKSRSIVWLSKSSFKSPRWVERCKSSLYML
ncbi:hypothetical protein HanIR_Chr14g0701311 [Helianthus annuus]|nr:hypothetical protein HanIR_Chr14g0701311 [Helianthus annuus]